VSVLTLCIQGVSLIHGQSAQILKLGADMKVTIEINADEFDFLFDTSMNWKSVDWETQDGRFTPLPDYRKFERAYWFDSYANLILARAYLAADGYEFSVHSDESEQGGWVLLTDFGLVL